ncbi:hypothetical protein Lste_2803 [Legionella steelei]|uniref:Uncharacterized protein n=1 Tax=Legionella steelei TaxID=947033 RepID=A0A0W0ZKE5_9GAMM|nr:hypothetical protein Lste_2803 [Legionella steelei]OJW07244.1 MAG: hypothetical protein BGO44_16600 [Legionella sp. 39-23]
MIKNFILQKFVALLWFGFCLFFFMVVANHQTLQYLFSSKSEAIQNIHNTFKPLFYRNLRA